MPGSTFDKYGEDVDGVGVELRLLVPATF